MKRYVRGYAEYLGNSTFRYHYNTCNHTFTEILMSGPKGRNSKHLRKPVMHEFCIKMGSYWGKGQGLNLEPCKTCKRKKRLS